MGRLFAVHHRFRHFLGMGSSAFSHLLLIIASTMVPMARISSPAGL
jgi:hypothetical protein